MNIIFNINNLESFSIFDKLDTLSDNEYKQLKRKAKLLYIRYLNKNNFNNEVCFISTSDLHGFYFPNLENIRCISFINKKPFILINDEKEKTDKTKIKQIKIFDKNYGGIYTFYLKGFTFENITKYHISCDTPENAFGYNDSVILYNVMQFDNNKKFIGYKKQAYSLNRRFPNWILKRIEKILINLSIKYNCE